MNGFLPEPLSSLSSAAGDEGCTADPSTILAKLDGLRLEYCDGEQLIDALMAATKLVGHLEAFALQVGAELMAEPTEEAPDRAGGNGDLVAPAIACHLGRSRGRAHRDLGLAMQLTQEFTETLWALDEGLIERDGARLIAAELSLLSDTEARARLELQPLAWLREHEHGGSRRTWSQLKSYLQRAVARMDPAAAEARHQRARGERDFTLQVSPHNDSTADLTLYGVALDRAVQIHGKVDATARKLRRGGDTRTLCQLRADLAEHLLLGEPSAVESGQGEAHGEARFMFTMPLTDLAGLEDSGTAETTGYGPILTEVARRVVENHLENPNAHFMVAVTHPVSGKLIHLHPMSKSRYFTGWLRAAIDATYQTCAHPACNKAAIHCEGDHIIEWAAGGETSQANGQPLCRQHHHDLDQRGWKRTPTSRHQCAWTSPYGHTYKAKPPPMVDVPPPF